MSEEKLLILGAGIYQVPLIRKAREQGLRTIVVSIPGDYPGIALADQFAPLDTRDRDAVLELARREAVNGVCTCGTDVAVGTMGYVCDRLGLPGISGEAAARVTDKLRMKEALRAGGVSTADFRRADSLDQALAAAEELGYPVVVKAPDSSGSRGIVCADDREALAEAYGQAAAVSRRGYVLVEQFIRGLEIGVDGYVGKQGIEACFPHGKYTYTFEGSTMPVGHYFPWHGSPGLCRELRRQMELAAEALGLADCSFNADVFVEGEQVWIIEVGGRTGATCIPELLSLYTGRDWYGFLIDAALGRRQPLPAGREECACGAKLIFSPVDGLITDIDEAGLAALRGEGVACSMDYGTGCRVSAMRNGTDRIGQLIAPVSDEAGLDALVSRMRSCICLDRGNLEEIWRETNLEN